VSTENEIISIPRDLHLAAKASSSETNTRAIFLLAAKKAPFFVYANPFYSHAGYGNVFSVTGTGALAENVQNYPYQPDSGIHGMVFDPTETHLYSADMGANKIWIHRKDRDPQSNTFGHLEKFGVIDAPSPKDHPRWVAMHPSGDYLYVLMESGNRICEFVIVADFYMPTYTGNSFPLIPPGIRTHDSVTGKGLYRADVCEVSHSGRYLFASSRSNKPGELTGYMAVFRLREDGSIEKQLCLSPTPTSGGHSNAVSPCPWSDEWLAITDDDEGSIEVYRWHDEFLYRVARLRIPEPGFGMNAIWYD
jgi:carboxy-cis,cis-muconate cyclase